MKKRSAAASAATKAAPSLLVSPLPLSSPSPDSPFRKSYVFNTSLGPSSSIKKTKPPPPSPLLQRQSPPHRTLSSISDLKDLVSSQIDSINRHQDLAQSEILKEIDALSRLSKRFKIQSQACQQVTEEAGKDYTKLYDWVCENTEVMKASYAEFITEAQASASRVCKVSIPELTRSMEKAIEGLRFRYQVPSATI